MNISYSRVSSYLSCPYKHYLGYEVGLSPKKPAKPLQFGTDFHKLLENRIHPEKLPEVMKEIGETYYDMPASWQTELGDDYIQNLSVIFQDYQEIYQDSKLPTKTEEEFLIPMGKARGEDVIFKGIMDEVYKTKSRTTGHKSIKIADHKTFTRKPDSMFLVMNTQMALYCKASEFLWGMLPEKVMWDYISSTPAEEPLWLEKSQRFSTAKSQKVTPMSYKRACQRRGVEPEKNLIDAYQGNVYNFFFRVELDVIPGMVDSIWEGFSYTATEIANNGYKNKTKNISSMQCSFCAYKDICYTELTGGDVDYLIEKDFIKKEDKP